MSTFRAVASGPTSPPASKTTPNLWNDPEDIRIQEPNELKKKTRQGHATSRCEGGVVGEGRGCPCLAGEQGAVGEIVANGAIPEDHQGYIAVRELRLMRRRVGDTIIRE